MDSIKAQWRNPEGKTVTVFDNFTYEVKDRGGAQMTIDLSKWCSTTARVIKHVQADIDWGAWGDGFAMVRDELFKEHNVLADGEPWYERDYVFFMTDGRIEVRPFGSEQGIDRVQAQAATYAEHNKNFILSYMTADKVRKNCGVQSTC